MSDDGRPVEIRRVIANIVLTLDGRTTGPAGEFDMSYIAPHGISNQMRDALVEMTNATTVLLGRKNYGGSVPTGQRSLTAQTRRPAINALEVVELLGLSDIVGRSDQNGEPDSRQ